MVQQALQPPIRDTRAPQAQRVYVLRRQRERVNQINRILVGSPHQTQIVEPPPQERRVQPRPLVALRSPQLAALQNRHQARPVPGEKKIITVHFFSSSVDIKTMRSREIELTILMKFVFFYNSEFNRITY